MRTSSKFPQSEECYQEVLLVTRAAGYPFATSLNRLELPVNAYRSCFANLITVDTASNSSTSISTQSVSTLCGLVIPRIGAV